MGKLTGLLDFVEAMSVEGRENTYIYKASSGKNQLA